MTLLAAINWHSVTFLLFALIACGFAAAVVMTSNIVRMAFYLTLSLGATSGLFFLAGAEFVGAMQLMIYVGGTLVLLIFGVMLTAQVRFISMQTHAGEWVIAAVLGSALLGLLLLAGLNVESWHEPRPDLDKLPVAAGKTSTPIGLALAGVRVDKLDEPDERLRGGMSGYLFPFVIISMHLLVVLIGAGYMARTKRARSGLAPAAPVPARRIRRRKFAVTAGLFSGILVNLVLAALAFGWYFRRPAPPAGTPTIDNFLELVRADLVAAPGWLFLLLGGLLLANVLLLVVVYFWQSWGVIGLVLVPIAAAIAVSQARLGAPYSAAVLILLLLPVIPLIVLLCSGPRPTMWEQMD
jgi:NADH:ubiquinone oxidoreductase subunit 6 (subunit J)